MNETAGAEDDGRRARLRALIGAAQRQAREASRDQATAAGERQSDVSAVRGRRQADPGIDVFAACLPTYQVLGEIHRGGQGVVYEALHRSSRRRVAIKVLREGPFASAAERARFDREVQLLAQLNHPNIVAIHDSGLAAGHYYLVMDYIAGVPPDRWIAAGGSPAAGGRPGPSVVDPARRDEDGPAPVALRLARAADRGPRCAIEPTLRLFMKICDAVNAAHLRGVIHRDLKPGNILVDAAGEPHVLDFGLAKEQDGDAAAASLDVSSGRRPAVTQTGQFVGSLPWASPEQAAGTCPDIDVRTDVYSLGVILYQMLSGRLPHDPRGDLHDVLGRIAHAQPAPLRPLAPHVDDEVETIVLRCLQKERERRYQTAGELARDVERYLSGRPIDAKRDSGWYVLRKTLRRYRVRAAVAGAFVLLVSGAAVALSVLYAQQGRLLIEVGHARDQALVAERLADDRYQDAQREAYAANIAAAAAAISAQDGGAALGSLRSAPAALRHWEWRYLLRQADQSAATWHGPADLITARVRLSRSGRQVAASFWMEQRAGALRVWRRDRDDPICAIDLAMNAIPPIEFVDDGESLLACDRDGTSVRFDPADAAVIKRSPTAGLVDEEQVVDFWPAARVLLSVGAQGDRLWDLVSGREPQVLPMAGRPVWSASLDPRRGRVALGLCDGDVMLCDIERGRELGHAAAHTGMVFGTTFSPDGRLLATAGEGGDLKLWELEPGEAPPSPDAADRRGPALRLLRRWSSGAQRNGILAFSRDGVLLAAPSEDKAVRVWSVDDGALRATLLGHATGVVCTAFGEDGRWLVSGARGGVVKLWDLQRSPAAHVIRDFPNAVQSLAFTRDGTRLLLCCKAVCVVDVAAARREADLPPAPATDGALIVAGPHGLQAAASNYDGTLSIWDGAASDAGRVLGRHASKPQLAGCASQGVLASADAESLVLWDWAGAGEKRRFAGPGAAVRGLALSPDAARVALGLANGDLLQCDLQTGRYDRVAQGRGAATTTVAFSPDGRRLLTGSDDGDIALWDAASGEAVWRVAPQLGDLWSVAFSPDGARIAAGGRDRSVRVFDARDGHELLALRGPTGTVMCVAFSPDGQRIAAGSWARELFLWDAGDAPGGE